MNKRNLILGALAGLSVCFPSGAIARRPKHAPIGPAVLTVSGRIGSGNRGPLNPALDQLMVKQGLAFKVAHAFDFAALSALPSASINPTLEYDRKRHTLSGPLLSDVLAAAGAKIDSTTACQIRAIDGYAVVLSAAELIERRFVVATHLDGQPMGLGGLGPCWVVFDADRFSDVVRKPLNERFALCPWATYHIEVIVA